jgi:hypothetical protein
MRLHIKTEGDFMKLEKKVAQDAQNSYHSTKCIGAGNGRKQSAVTGKVRRQANKKIRQALKNLDTKSE